MIGTVLESRYTIEREIGAGGMAEVYLAYDSVEDRSVAVKLIKPEYCSDPQYARRFEREAAAVMKLDCPNIVRAYCSGVWEGRSYIVMEYVEGMTLKDYLGKHGKLSQKAAVHIACRVLNALDCAHKGGYVHRDVKPQNVLISTDRTIKLTDFGIAKDTASLTMTFNGKSVVGSVHYISPEQVSGETVSVESDLYSVGIMLYEMLIGHPPFEGDTPVQIAYKHVNEQVVPPMELDPEISPALSDVILKATAKKRSVRYSSAEAMKQDLVRALREPEERFAYLEPEELMNDRDDGGKKNGSKSGAKLWHFILPASLMVALVIGMFTFWYFAMFANGNKSGLSKVPDVIGRSLEDAGELLRNREFDYRVVGTIADPEYPEGEVCKQSPESGKSYAKGTVVEIWLSSGGIAMRMDDLVGMTLDEALAKLEQLRLSIDSISYESSDSPEGTIVWQSIPEGTEFVPGEESVSVIISGYQGETLVPMPNLTRVTSLGGINQILDVYGVVSHRYRFGSGSKGSSLPTNGLVEAQLPSAGLPFLPSATTVEIWLHPEYGRISHANVDFELVIDQDGTDVMVVLLSEYGEFVLYESSFDKSDQLARVEFEAGYMQEGFYTLIVYTNGTEAMRFDAEFTKR